MISWPVLVAPIAAFASSLVLTPAVRRYALKTGLIDKPNHRSSHFEATARGGGLAVLLAVFIGLAIAVLSAPIGSRIPATILVGGALLGAVGWIDDRRGVSARIRLTVHFGAAAWAVAMLGGLPSIAVGQRVITLGPIGYVAAVIGIVWSINLFNFMDGIDGLAGSQSALVLGASGLLLLLRGDAQLGCVALVLAAAVAGFVPWNWPRAKIFLGDVGSGPLGYFVAVLAIASENQGAVPLLTIAMISGVFVADATVTLARRVMRREKLTEAHRNHAYQRLSRAVGSHRTVTVAAAAVTVTLALLGVFVTANPSTTPLMLGLAVAMLAILLLLVERKAPMLSARRGEERARGHG